MSDTVEISSHNTIFQILQDTENIQNPRNIKRDNVHQSIHAGKRQPLSTITNQSKNPTNTYAGLLRSKKQTIILKSAQKKQQHQRPLGNMNPIQRQNLPTYIRQQHQNLRLQQQQLQHPHHQQQQDQHHRLSGAKTLDESSAAMTHHDINPASSTQLLSDRVLSAAVSVAPVHSAKSCANASSQNQPLQAKQGKPARLKVFQDVTQQYINNANNEPSNSIKDSRNRFSKQKVEPLPAVTAMECDEILPAAENLRQPPRKSTSCFFDDSAMDEDPIEALAREVHRKELRYAALQQNLQHVLTIPYCQPAIYKYMRMSEVRNHCRASYIPKQPDINIQMRIILGDWLIEVAEEYKLQRETLFLAINYVDRFLSQMSVLRGKLQLVGTAAIFLASKYEEIYPPEVSEFVYITDDTYTKSQVLRMEVLILKVLQYDLSPPTCNVFAEKFLSNLGENNKSVTYCLTMYLIEMSILDMETFIRFRPSKIAAAAVCLANFTLKQEPWPEVLIENSMYHVRDFEFELRCLHHFFKVKVNSIPQQSLHDKYKNNKYRNVSGIVATNCVEGIFTSV